jgi:chemotaxis protein methyltransferase CheR
MLLFSDADIAGRPVIRVWSAGCAGGEEVYSLKILEAEQRQAGSGARVLSILATDKNPENIRRAKQGAYPPSSLKELPPATVSTFFDSTKGGRRFVVLPFLTENIGWRCHDLLGTLPQREFDALFLRNSLLTYYGEQTRKKVLADLLERLAVGGFLVVGSHERLPDGFGFMVRDRGHPSIWWPTAGGR